MSVSSRVAGVNPSFSVAVDFIALQQNVYMCSDWNTRHQTNYLPQPMLHESFAYRFYNRTFQTLANPDKIHADKPTHMYTGGVGRKSARAQKRLRTEPLHTQSISQSEHTHTQTHTQTDFLARDIWGARGNINSSLIYYIILEQQVRQIFRTFCFVTFLSSVTRHWDFALLTN